VVIRAYWRRREEGNVRKIREKGRNIPSGMIGLDIPRVFQFPSLRMSDDISDREWHYVQREPTAQHHLAWRA